MSSFGIAITVSFAAVGALLVYAGMRAQRPALDAADYLAQLDDEGLPVDEFERRLGEPFIMRIMHPLGQALNGLGRLTPRNYVEGVHKKLLHAGMANTVRAEEFVVGQVALTAITTLGAVMWVVPVSYTHLTLPTILLV